MDQNAGAPAAAVAQPTARQQPADTSGLHFLATIRYPLLHQLLALDRVTLLLVKAREAAPGMSFQWVKLQRPKHGECFLMLRPEGDLLVPMQAQRKSPIDGYQWSAAHQGLQSITVALSETSKVNIEVCRHACEDPIAGPLMRFEYRLMLPSNRLTFVHYLAKASISQQPQAGATQGLPPPNQLPARSLQQRQQPYAMPAMAPGNPTQGAPFRPQMAAAGYQQPGAGYAQHAQAMLSQHFAGQPGGGAASQLPPQPSAFQPAKPPGTRSVGRPRTKPQVLKRPQPVGRPPLAGRVVSNGQVPPPRPPQVSREPVDDSSDLIRDPQDYVNEVHRALLRIDARNAILERLLTPRHVIRPPAEAASIGIDGGAAEVADTNGTDASRDRAVATGATVQGAAKAIECLAEQVSQARLEIEEIQQACEREALKRACVRERCVKIERALGEDWSGRQKVATDALLHDWAVAAGYGGISMVRPLVKRQ